MTLTCVLPRATVQAALLASLACACTWATLPAASAADTLEGVFARANEAYFKGDFAQAAKRYGELVAAGVRDVDVFYNQGLAHARLGELGRAILAFERAAAVAPGDQDVERALAQAREAVGRRLADKHGEATVRTRPPLRKALVRPFSKSLLAWLLLVCNAGLFGALIARRFQRSETRRLGLGAAAAVLAGLTAVMGTALAIKLEWGEPGRAALVVAPGTHLYEGPDARAQRRGAVGEGSLARLLATEGTWSRIRVRGGAEGWVESDRVGAVDPD